MDRSFFLSNLWRWKCGLPEEVQEEETIDGLYKSEWSATFEGLMRNRLVMGRFRYAPMRDHRKPQYARVMSIQKRLNLYKVTGNLEHLVDCANLCLLEFVEGEYAGKHFSSVDDGIHMGVK
jgi:hypothetical protein